MRSMVPQNTSTTSPGEFKKVQEMDFHLSRIREMILARKVHESWYTDLF